MNKIIPVGIIGTALAIATFIAFTTQNDITPDRFGEIRRGDELVVTVPYTNNQTALEGPTNVNVMLTTPAVFSLVNYQVGSIYKSAGNHTEIGIIRLVNTTYTVKYEDHSGKKELSGNDTSGVSFDAKTGTDVTYDLSHKIVLFEGETVEFKYRFNTSAAQIGTYDIEAVVNDNPILYRVKVRT